MDGNTQLEDSRPAAVACLRLPVHGLVAIANGPDFCLCGNAWPCRPAREADAVGYAQAS